MSLGLALPVVEEAAPAVQPAATELNEGVALIIATCAIFEKTSDFYRAYIIIIIFVLYYLSICILNNFSKHSN